jgi:hypothetical protein
MRRAQISQTLNRRPELLERISIFGRKVVHYLFAPVLPVVGLGLGVWIVIRAVDDSHGSPSARPFWMLLAGALIFGFLPLVWNQLFHNRYNDHNSDETS